MVPWRRRLDDVGRQLRQVRPLRHTVLREIYEAPLPPPRAFASFGEGSWLVPPCVVAQPEEVAVGAGVIVLEHLDLRVVGPSTGRVKVVLGDGVRLTRYATIVSEVEVVLEAGVASSDCITILDTWRDVDRRPGQMTMPEPAPVCIEAGAYLGYGCTIGPGVRVGAGAFVGEGAVVSEDVPPATVVYGNPARVVRRYIEATGSWEGRRWP